MKRCAGGKAAELSSLPRSWVVDAIRDSRRYTQLLSIRVEESLVRRLDEMSDDLGLSRSEVAREALTVGLPEMAAYWSARSEGDAGWRGKRGG